MLIIVTLVVNSSATRVISNVAIIIIVVVGSSVIKIGSNVADKISGIRIVVVDDLIGLGIETSHLMTFPNMATSRIKDQRQWY